MRTRTLSWVLLSGFGLFGFAGPSARAETDAAQANTAILEPARSGVGVAAEQTGQQSGRAANDASLATDLKMQLADQVTDGNDIRVGARDGVVSLSGTVGSQVEKQNAVSLASHTDGVRRVEDRLKVQQPR